MRFHLSALLFACLLVAPALCSAGELTAPAFTKKPTAVKSDNKVKVEFAVDRETDVAVFVEDAQGKIVRHLIAGVLGKNPPEPLKPNSLEQSIEWDGKDDDGKPVGGAGFKFRVGLGLKAAYAGQPFAEKDQAGPNGIERIIGLTAGPDGRLYALVSGTTWLTPHWSLSKMHVFRRDGSYEKTIKPFPSNTPIERAKANGAFINSFGGFNPLIHRAQGLSFYSCEDVPHQSAVTFNGRVVLAVVGEGGPHLAVLDVDGGIPNSTYAGPALGAGLRYTGYPLAGAGHGYAVYPFLVVGSDSTTVYLTGFGLGSPVTPPHAIYSVKLPEQGPALVWFGNPAKSGSDNASLNDPRGLAVDGKGHVMVADFGNNRVVVINEKDRSIAGTFTVATPNWLGVHPKTGAVYVQSGEAVIKFSPSTGSGPASWENAKEQCRMALPKQTRPQLWRLALDGSAEPAVLWAASGARLLRCEDQGAKFSDPAPAGCFRPCEFWRPAADPTRREVLCKTTVSLNGYEAKLRILDEETGQIRGIGGGVPQHPSYAGRTHRLGPDGAIYAQDEAGCLGGVIRYDRDGKLKPFEATLKNPFLRGRLPVGATGTATWERDFSVDRKGDIYVKARGPEYHGLMNVHVYDQSGNLKRIALQVVSDGAYGPRVDPKGNLYIMETVKPLGQPFPEEFKDRVKKQHVDFDWIYGSVVKFGPEGGAVWFSGSRASPLTYEGWRIAARGCVSDLRTTGGRLVATVLKAPATLSFPSDLCVDAAANSKITFRMKNDSDGNQAMLIYRVVSGDWASSGGDSGFMKAIAIKPNSDFTEYTFDMAGEMNWKGTIQNLSLEPTSAAKGGFSIDWVRIGEAGGKLVWNFNAEDGPEKKLPAAMKKEHVGAFGCGADGAILQGALWYRPGFSPLGDMGVSGPGCHCEGTDFDVDDFGRTFAPDTGRFRVGVLDTNGNEIMSIGAYGNQDNCGPDSYVLDPAGKFLRPRRAGDPKDLVSPFAKPDIAFAWIIGVAVTDRYAYVADGINKRVLRVKLGYVVQENCDIE